VRLRRHLQREAAVQLITGLGLLTGFGRLAGEPPEQGDPERREGEGPDDDVAPPEAELTEDQQQAEGQEAYAGRDPPAAAAPPSPLARFAWTGQASAPKPLLAIVITTIPTRVMTGSMPSLRAKPAQTPPSTARRVSRRSLSVPSLTEES
jgi:hypothetical protein